MSVTKVFEFSEGKHQYCLFVEGMQFQLYLVKKSGDVKPVCLCDHTGEVTDAKKRLAIMVQTFRNTVSREARSNELYARVTHRR